MPFCKAEGSGPLSLTTGLVAKIWCFHHWDLAPIPGWEPRGSLQATAGQGYWRSKWCLHHETLYQFVCCCHCSVAKACPTLWSRSLQHTRLSCPSLSPGVCSSSCPLSQWYYLTISSSATLFSFWIQSFPASGSFPVSHFQWSCPALSIRWPKYWSFSFSPFNEYSGLISFKTDWFDLLAVQETLKSLCQYHNFKASNFWCLVFFMAQLSHPYKTTRKTIALIMWTFVNKVISLAFTMLFRWSLIAFLTRSKCLNVMATVTIHSDFGAEENKVCNCFQFFPFCLSWRDATQCHDLSFLNVEF